MESTSTSRPPASSEREQTLTERSTVWRLRGLGAITAGCLVWFGVVTWRWPLVGDAVSVHYLILLLQHGMAPYRQIVDAQMPGTYLVDWVVVHTFGDGAGGLRIFDFTLMAAAIAAMLAIAWPADAGNAAGIGAARGIMKKDHRWAAFLAGGLFAILHGRDGIPQAGQRDLIMAVMLLAAYACTFHALRRNRPLISLAAGFGAATAVTIKPTVVPAAFVVLLLAIVHLRRRGQPWVAQTLAMLTGTALPVLAVAVFLIRERAVGAFVDALRGMWPYYATLQRRPLGYLLAHSLSRMLPLVCIWLLALLLQSVYGQPPDAGRRWERAALYLGMLLSLASFLAQGKGFPYHRYPFLAFLTLVVMLDCSRAFQTASNKSLVRFAGALGLIVAAAFLMPFSVHKISAFDWRNDDYYNQMSADLNRLGGSALSGKVQCLDTFSGCITTLDRMGLVQSTGFLVDFYFFAPRPDPVVSSMQRQFWNDLERNPPRVFIVSKQVFPTAFSSNGEPIDTYDKLKQWPQFDAYLQDHYALIEEHDWSRPVLWSSHAEHPAGYRLYLRRP